MDILIEKEFINGNQNTEVFYGYSLGSISNYITPQTVT